MHNKIEFAYTGTYNNNFTFLSNRIPQRNLCEVPTQKESKMYKNSRHIYKRNKTSETCLY